MRWPSEAIWEAVAPQLAGFTVEVWPEVDSTNSELMRRAHGGQTDPLLLVAERQTAGRGRLGRDWQSGGNGSGTAGLPALTFSLGLPLHPVDWSGLSLAVGLSVVQSLHPALQLKWPNDVWLQDRKLAGILIETTSVADLRYAIIGIGINILPPEGDGMRTPPAALVELLPEADAPAVLLRVVPDLVRRVLAFEAEGFAPLRADFHARDVLYGRQVIATNGTAGLASGVDGSGALLVHTAGGVQKISSAEVSVRPMHAAEPSMKRSD